jgi:Tfp pilus assembly protein PilX
MTVTLSLRQDERGSALIIAVIAMLLVSLMLMSLALFGRVEGSIGLNYRFQAQAAATAEAGLDWARDQVRSAGAAGAGSGFTPWFDGTKASHMLTSGGGQALGPFQFRVRIDNDCASANTVPEKIQEGPTCNNSVDTNETAMLTSWAVVGNGRARVRAQVIVDSPWKHVCANSKNDPGGPFCTSADNTKGNPSVIPADVQDPNGPRGFDDLPRPVIGCSRIDPSLHSNSVAEDCPSHSPNLFAQPAAPGYPAYPPVPADGGPMLVIMGDDPAITPTAKKCNIDAGTGIYYFGYFDCALSTPCTTANGCASPKKACVKSTDSRVDPTRPSYFNPTHYASAGPGCGANTGMVWSGSPSFSNVIGSPASPVVLYVMHDKSVSMAKNGSGKANLHLGGGTYVNGTVVVEGNVMTGNKSYLCAGGPAPSPLPANSCPTPQTGYSATKGYGYPLALLLYDPKLPYPTVTPQAPQPITTNGGFNNTDINGSVYSGGTLSFNPIHVNGSIVAFNIRLQAATSAYTYVPEYGTDAPPAGFLPGGAGGSSPVVLTPKTFIACTNFNDDSGGATACQ